MGLRCNEIIMALKCTECGQVFDDKLNECPNCACPASECEVVEKRESQQQTENKQKSNSSSSWNRTAHRETGYGGIHDNYNEAEPYTPFSPISWFSKDPWPLTKFPKGSLDVKYPLIGFLFAPWHLTCLNKSKRESYDVLNNVFYFFNLLFKTLSYATAWVFWKGWKFELLLLICMMLVAWGIDQAHDSKILVSVGGIILFAMYLTLIVFSFILTAFGCGKALHRYWDDIYRTFMRLNKRYWISMHKSVKAGTFDDID